MEQCKIQFYILNTIKFFIVYYLLPISDLGKKSKNSAIAWPYPDVSFDAYWLSLNFLLMLCSTIAMISEATFMLLGHQISVKRFLRAGESCKRNEKDKTMKKIKSKK